MKTPIPFLGLVLLGAVLPAAAKHHEQTPFLTGFFNIYNGATEKTLSLAEAIPESKYDWRPGDGVRSVRETIAHIAAANYFIGGMLGATLPEGVNPRSFTDTIKTKSEAIAALKTSADFIRSAIQGVPESDYGTEVQLFGNTAPKIQVILLVGDHASEHLGQLIAYARSNDVVPPWSRRNSG